MHFSFSVKRSLLHVNTGCQDKNEEENTLFNKHGREVATIQKKVDNDVTWCKISLDIFIVIVLLTYCVMF